MHTRSHQTAADPVTTNVLLDELRALIGQHGGPGATPLPALPGLILAVEHGPTLPCPLVVEPVFSLVAQGAKRVEVGQQSHDYRAGQFLIVSIDLPVDAYVVEATSERPCLGCGIALRPETIASLLLESGRVRSERHIGPSIAISELSGELVDAVVRLLRLLDRPSDVPILAAALEREILWRLINGPQGALVRQIGLADSRLSQIGRAVRWLRSHYAEPIRIEQLAEIAGMSITSLHRHFRGITSLTPIQYQKQLRLQAARARLIATRENVAEVGFAVGYDSPSQFSREYRRMYGKPPSQDGMDLRGQATAALPRRPKAS